ncbi:3-isopropylmalate dehydrogenase [Actinomycetospora sp. TBRC 11914]|uniref:3-isopropylmalate dehydrogenase n=1 Tax=Actinomycetospora sp. TBRC 11914 TaxID=2729387 RepID=UPI00145EC070|nr:3-isopropylmalate dehydrogenase [Actinomycetospora sp. TBRC 11914]NMO92299.1 3-isopropylmalate dehydrogenase [Actinomycetospora sp. TBRC 11914]
MPTHDLAVVAGDGIGPDVTVEALRSVRAAADRFGFGITTTDYDLGAERWLRDGVALDDASLEGLRRHDAILLGAVGDPRVPPGVLERGLVVALRVALRHAVNVRPVRLYPGVTSPVRDLTPERCDLVIIRENTEGLYAGGGSTVHRGTDEATAIQTSVTTTAATRACVGYAFRLARARRRRLTLCHKTNILVEAGALWSGIVEEIGHDHPEVAHDYVHADAMCQHLPLAPERFDVVVTDNLFGDIISDLGATLQGGLGVAASGNINPAGDTPSMFEPVHGSAPDIAGTGRANPVAAVLSAAMCLAGLGEREAALALEAAAASVLAELPVGPALGDTTAGVGRRIAERVRDVDPGAVVDPDASLMTALSAAAPRTRRGGGG